MHSGGDAEKDEGAIGLRVGAVFGAVIEGDAGGVEGFGGVGEAESALDGCCDYGGGLGEGVVVFVGCGEVRLDGKREDGEEEGQQ
mmetsp:Transcript_11504/g.20692  ORF Transcript_11504/g.20692 Transcript_11504/m.20692 type:complete len:85 (+) Transcript_11504:791-1045(+)